MNRPDYIVDIAGLGPKGDSGGAAGGQTNKLAGRPWLAIHWRCCEVYSRVYRNPAGTAYEGRCPTCGKKVSVRVGAGGTNCRFFEAG
jgi:hypothetical protein